MKNYFFPKISGRNRDDQAVLSIPLLLCSYTFGNEGDRAILMERTRSLTSSGEKRLSSILETHRLKPLFYAACLDAAERDREKVHCPDLFRDCEMDWRGHLFSTTLLDHHLELILSLFAQSNLQVIPLKGPYLSWEVYGKRDIRPYRDIDLLVREDELPQVISLLRETGFKPTTSVDSFIPLPYSTHYTKVLEGERLKVDVDLHVSIHWPRDYFRKTRFRVEEIWRHSSPSTLKGIAIQAMSPEHLVIYTALDLAINHRFARLINFRDLYEIFRRFQVNLEEVCYWSRLWEVRSYVYLALHLLGELLEEKLSLPPLPEYIRPQYLTLRLLEGLLDPRKLPICRPRMINLSNLLFLLLGDSPRARFVGAGYLPYHLWRRIRFRGVR